MKTPPEKQQKESPTTKEENTFAKWIAFILDDLIKIPGTKKRIGLDPIIGLIPGVGDFATSTAGLSLLAIGAKKHIPLSVYLRMIANWMLNSLVGALPFIGDIFSFWYKSNHRNHTRVAVDGNACGCGDLIHKGPVGEPDLGAPALRVARGADQWD